LTPDEDIKFPGTDNYPKWLIPVILAFSLPVFAYFAYYHNPFRGFIASLSAGVVLTTSLTLRDLRGYFTFWLTMLICVLFHVSVIFLFQRTDSHFPGIIFTPIVIGDIMLWQYISVNFIRKFRI
jgi:hypothetical protein